MNSVVAVTPNRNYLYSDLTEKIIKAALKVHRQLGPGFIEKLYQRALEIELTNNKIKVEREKLLKLTYEGVNIGSDKVDFMVEEKVLVELKAVSELSDVHRAQLISYLKASKLRVGLLINFAQIKLQVKRVIV